MCLLPRLTNFIIFSLLASRLCCALDPLPEKYLVAYGSPDAPIKITEYYSFQCPHCLSLFRRDFKKIETYIDSKKVYWIFHPVPADLVTVQGMICMERLNPRHKKLYLETMLAEADASNPETTVLIMSKVMEIFKQPVPELQDEKFIEQTESFSDAFTFLTQKEKIMAVPTIEVNQKLFPQEVPDFEFVQSIIQQQTLRLDI